VTDWTDVRSWTGKGLRREAFYVRSGDADVFVSLWEPAKRRPSFGLLVCPAWGLEGTTTCDLQTGLARAAAEGGGLGVAFHYPGHNDSTGDVETSTIDVMTRATVDCARDVRDRFDGRWIVAGIRLGASVAALVSSELQSSRLLFVNEALDPSAYFEGLIRRARRASLAYPGSEGIVFGVPLSEAVVRSSAGRAVEVVAAISRAGGRVTSLRYSRDPNHAESAGIESITVDGEGPWLTRSSHRGIVAAATRWLERAAVEQS